MTVKEVYDALGSLLKENPELGKLPCAYVDYDGNTCEISGEPEIEEPDKWQLEARLVFGSIQKHLIRRGQ